MRSGAEKRKKKKGAFRVFLAVMLVFVVLVLAAAAVYSSYIDKPELPPEPEKKEPIVVVDPDTGETTEVEPAEKISGTRKSKDFYTILLVGTDTASSSTDTIMLVSYDVTNQNATVMSIPRDTLVSTFGTNRYTRINSIYAAYGRGEAGMDALSQAVSELVGFMPDYRVFVGWELVGQMVDMLGGIEFDVPFHMEYDDPAQNLHIYVEKGLQTLNGDQAMQLVRWRKNNPGVSSGGGTGSDLDRLKVQQGFLKAVLKQTLQIENMTLINEIAEMFSSHVTGTLTLQNILWFAKEAVFGGLSVDNVQFLTMPWSAANPYVYPNKDKLLELINTRLNPFQTEVTIDQLDLIYFDDEGEMHSTGQK